ncbi:MAG: 50S ribosomal protein L5 [Candidatus Omnitrophica bacterium]|nr:50S ribosomal protein L5 [Candidatus Omnitrophota bacterium]
MPRLLEKYRKEIIPQMVKKFGYKNKMQVPRLEKIVINIGCGEAAHEAKILEQISKEITFISGQKCVQTKAKKSISNFKLRKGMIMGCKVTLRRKKMYDFLNRLVNVALPRIRDFSGLKNVFDQQGNYNLGIKEQLIFPEIDHDKTDKIRGMDIALTVTNNKTKEEAKELLKMFGMPFRKTVNS